MGCGYSTPKSVRDEILEIEHLAKSETREKKYNKNNKYNKNSK
jgi:hypothetical protein